MLPFLRAGAILACFQSLGRKPLFSDSWKMLERYGASSGANSFRSLHGMSSGPEALCGLMLLISFSTPKTAIMMLFMPGKGFPSSLGIEVRSSFVNTDLNWAFKISALVTLSECRTPWRFSGATPGLSFLHDLTNFQNGFVLFSSNAALMMLLM